MKIFIYKIKKIIYKILNSFKVKGAEEKHSKYCEYLNSRKMLKIPPELYFTLNKIQNDLDFIKRTQVLNSLSGSLLDSYKISGFFENEVIQKSMIEQSLKWSESLQNESLAEIFYSEQIDLLNIFATNQGVFDIDLYEKIVFEFLSKTIPQKALIYSKILSHLFQYTHYSELIEKILSKMESELSDDYSVPLVHVLHISYLLWIKNDKKAENLLKKYIDNCDLTLLECYLPVANLAVQLGFKNEQIKESSRIFENIKANQLNKNFESYIKGKKVAIVENGTINNENAGKEIDSHDIVIRFNSFNSIEKFAQTHGTKTNVWSLNGNETSIDIENIDFYIVRQNCYLKNYACYIEKFNKYLDKGTNILYFPDNFWSEIRDDYSVESPSGGLQMIYWVKSVNPDFNDKNCFGFAFKNKNSTHDDFSTHYYNGKKELNGHSFDKEKAAILKILRGQKVEELQLR